ncbi:TetR/AcrR family transcriptional regulator [Nocardia sp. NPDC004168]|uniref:TetR/AcrR family transcriptional regulator n=1 Tax=Nocardia sp. NPDC004168 TaxID=3154452 RepID=UPI0033A295B7
MTRREQILRATADIIRREGLTALTTKKVAIEAGCAEGTIFNQFGDKGGLLAAVLASALPETQSLYESVNEVRQLDLGAALTIVILKLLDFYRASYPLVASALAERTLFDRYAAAHREKGTGPHQSWTVVRGLMQAYAARGALRHDVDIDMLALQVVGACQNAVWIELVNGPEVVGLSGQEFAERLAEAVARQAM